MGVEYINRISYKKDGVYISTKSSNDDMPYHSVKLERITEIYLDKGKSAADLELAHMFMDYCEPRGSHKSLDKFRFLFHSKKYHENYMEYIRKYDDEYDAFKKENPDYERWIGKITGVHKDNIDRIKADFDKAISEILEEYDKEHQLER